MGRPRFSMSKFKDFLSQKEGTEGFFGLQYENPLDKFLGHTAEAKVSVTKLLETIVVIKGDNENLIDEFCNNGGTITDVNGKNLCIEVKNGSFEIPRFCVKILRDS